LFFHPISPTLCIKEKKTQTNQTEKMFNAKREEFDCCENTKKLNKKQK